MEESGKISWKDEMKCFARIIGWLMFSLFGVCVFFGSFAMYDWRSRRLDILEGLIVRETDVNARRGYESMLPEMKRKRYIPIGVMVVGLGVSCFGIYRMNKV